MSKIHLPELGVIEKNIQKVKSKVYLENTGTILQELFVGLCFVTFCYCGCHKDDSEYSIAS